MTPADDTIPALVPAAAATVSVRAVAIPVDRAVYVVDSQSLLQGQEEVHIVHRGAVYRLRATRQGKLILTK